MESIFCAELPELCRQLWMVVGCCWLNWRQSPQSSGISKIVEAHQQGCTSNRDRLLLSPKSQFQKLSGPCYCDNGMNIMNHNGIPLSTINNGINHVMWCFFRALYCKHRVNIALHLYLVGFDQHDQHALLGMFSSRKKHTFCGSHRKKTTIPMDCWYIWLDHYGSWISRMKTHLKSRPILGFFYLDQKKSCFQVMSASAVVPLFIRMDWRRVVFPMYIPCLMVKF